MWSVPYHILKICRSPRRNKNIEVGHDGTRKQDWMRWRGPPAIYPTDQFVLPRTSCIIMERRPILTKWPVRSQAENHWSIDVYSKVEYTILFLLHSIPFFPSFWHKKYGSIVIISLWNVFMCNPPPSQPPCPSSKPFSLHAPRTAPGNATLMISILQNTVQ
jgi:hypothetical protein